MQEGLGMKKILIILISLALCAGLFVLFFGEKLGFKSNEETSVNVGADSNTGAGNKSGIAELSIAEQIAQSIEISSAGSAIGGGEGTDAASTDGIVLSYTQPQIPAEKHLSVIFEIFDETGKSIERYVSDAGWEADEKRYDGSAKDVKAAMKTENLSGKFAIVQVVVKDLNTDISEIQQLTINYDGSRSLKGAIRGGGNE